MAADATVKAALEYGGTLSGEYTTPDNVALVAGNLVLAPKEASPTARDIYRVVAGGPWTRATDVPLSRWMDVLVTGGAPYEGNPANAGSIWTLSTEGPYPRDGSAPLHFEVRSRQPLTRFLEGLEETPEGQVRLPARPGVMRAVSDATHETGMFGIGFTDRGVANSFEVRTAGRMLVRGLVPQPNYAAINLDPGVAYIPFHDNAAENTSPDIANHEIESATGQLVVGMMYLYVYHYGNVFAPRYLLSTTAPVGWTGGSGGPWVKGPAETLDTRYRYIGAVRAKNTADLCFQAGSGDGNQLFVRYLEDANAAPFLLVNGSATQTETAVSCASVVPALCRRAKVRISAGANAAVVVGSSMDAFALSGTSYLQRVSPGMAAEIDVELDSNREFTFANASANGSAVVQLLGYWDKR